MYSRENALRLVQKTGWEVEHLNDPEGLIQHYMVYKPLEYAWAVQALEPNTQSRLTYS